jgi:signal transduction histidine kinase
MPTRPLIFVLLAFLTWNTSRAQKTATDSLLSLVAKAKPDTNKVNLLISLGDQYQFGEQDRITAKHYYRKADSLSRQLNYKVGLYKSEFYYIDVLIQQGHYDTSMIMCQQLMTKAKQEKDTSNYMHALYMSAICHSEMQHYDIAARCYLQVADYYEQTKSMRKLAMCYNELMLVCRHAGQLDNAVAYGKKALDLYSQYCPPDKISSPLQNLATVYQAMQQPDKASPFLQKALLVSKKYHNEYDELTETINLADIMLREDPANSHTIDYIDRSLFLSKKQDADEMTCQALCEAATFYLFHNHPATAQIYMDSALAVANKTGLNSLKQQCYLLLSKVAYAEHDYIRAIAYDKLLDLTQEEINTANINRSIIDLQTKYETEKKETQIKQLYTEKHIQELLSQKRKIYIALLLFAIAALMLIGWLLYRNNLRKQKLLQTDKLLQEERITALEQEKQLMASQAMLQGQEEERSRLARDLHDGLGGILSGAKYSLNDMKENAIIPAENVAALERTMIMIDQSITELRRIAHNLMPESLSNQTLHEALSDYCSQVSSTSAVKINYYDLGMETLQPDNTVKITVYRIVQELISNIIKHANASTAQVQIIAKDNLLRITVEDDGKGFDIASLETAGGIGYKNIKSRIDFLKGRIDVRSTHEEGTSVYIEIPF